VVPGRLNRQPVPRPHPVAPGLTLDHVLSGSYGSAPTIGSVTGAPGDPVLATAARALARTPSPSSSASVVFAPQRKETHP
jgi:hypothetical protein